MGLVSYCGVRMNSRHILIDLPAEVADEAIANRIASRRVRSSRSALDVILLTVGTAGSVVSLMQSPGAVRDLARLLRSYVHGIGAPALIEVSGLHVAAGKQGKLLVTIEVSEDEIARFLDEVAGLGPTSGAE